jgi:hypothetical protein
MQTRSVRHDRPAVAKSAGEPGSGHAELSLRYENELHLRAEGYIETSSHVCNGDDSDIVGGVEQT